MKVEVDILGSPSLLVPTVSVNVKQHWTCPSQCKNHSGDGCRHKCIYCCLLTANKVAFLLMLLVVVVGRGGLFLTNIYWYSLLINVVSIIIVRSV